LRWAVARLGANGSATDSGGVSPVPVVSAVVAWVMAGSVSGVSVAWMVTCRVLWS
jgi:hypothetical protein